MEIACSDAQQYHHGRRDGGRAGHLDHSSAHLDTGFVPDLQYHFIYCRAHRDTRHERGLGIVLVPFLAAVRDPFSHVLECRLNPTHPLARGGRRPY